MDIEELTSVEQLGQEQRELAEIIGIKAYIQLVLNYGGSPLYIPKAETVLKEIRNKEIYEKFDGENSRLLAKKYGLSEKTIKKVVSEKRKS